MSSDTRCASGCGPGESIEDFAVELSISDATAYKYVCAAVEEAAYIQIVVLEGPIAHMSEVRARQRPGLIEEVTFGDPRQGG
jgi:hypothetical protein